MTRKRKQRINKKRKQVNKKQPKIEKVKDQDDLNLRFVIPFLNDLDDDYELAEVEDNKNEYKQFLQKLVCLQVIDFIEKNRERYHLSGSFSVNEDKDSFNYGNVDFSLKASEKFLCSFSIDPLTSKTKSMKVNDKIVTYQVPILTAVLNFLCSLPAKDDGEKSLFSEAGVDYE